MQKYEAFPIYVSKWISTTHYIIAGGGGDGIPNRIKIYSHVDGIITLVSELDTKKEVCLNLDYCAPYLVYTSLDKAHLYKIGRFFQFFHCKTISLVSVVDQRNIKLSMYQTTVAISDDTPRVNLFDISSGSFKTKRKFVMSSPVFDLSLGKNQLLAIEGHQVSDLKQHWIFKDASLRRACLASDRIFVLKSSKMGPSFLLQLDLTGSLRFSSKIHPKSANGMQVGDFVSICIGEGYSIYDLNGSHVYSKNNIHGFATSSISTRSANSNQLEVVSGGFDRSVSLVTTEMSNSKMWLWISLALILIIFLAYKLISMF